MADGSAYVVDQVVDFIITHCRPPQPSRAVTITAVNDDQTVDIEMKIGNVLFIATGITTERLRDPASPANQYR